MKKIFIFVFGLVALCIVCAASPIIFRTGIANVGLILDGKTTNSGWTVSTELNPDILTTTAGEIVFVSDCDTLVVDSLDVWETCDIDMITASGDTAHVKVERTARNPFETPNPRLLRIADSGRLSREQASFDIDALVYGLSQVHPDIFSVCRQEDFFRAVNRAKASLPDSLTPMMLYQALAPVVAMIGDGHTNMRFPYNSVFTQELKRFPVFVDVLTDHSLICTSSLDSIIPRGARILAVNGMGADEIITSMLPYVSGERDHFRISRIDAMFTALFQMLYAADEYTVDYQPVESNKILSHTFPAVDWAEIKKRCPSTKSATDGVNYSFSIDSIGNVAVLDFREFSDVEKMERFADSMFVELRKKDIGNLIIDIRRNGGGNSRVGDILLRYISPEPFIQMDKALIRVTPLTSTLMGETDIEPMFIFQEADTSQFIRPRSAAEGHYTGKVYLLTSNKTFSSAGSFSWAFKECGMGTVVGEETGGMNVCYGDILSYSLPVSGLSASISFKRFWQLRADENDIHGTIPDVEVPAARAMEEAMKLVRKNKRTR